MDATPIHQEFSPTGAGPSPDWLASFLGEVETPTATFNYARFLDSQPSTPVLSPWSATPQTFVGGQGSMTTNAFCMATVEEGDQAAEPVPSCPQPVAPIPVSDEKHAEGLEEGWMPPANAIMGGA